MYKIERLTPFLLTQQGSRLTLAFTYQSFMIRAGGLVYQLLPLQKHEIRFNKQLHCVENVGDVFNFQCGNRFLEIPLYQLLLVSDLMQHLHQILEGEFIMKTNVEQVQEISFETEQVVRQLEHENRLRLIDRALETNNVQLFKELTEGLQEI